MFHTIIIAGHLGRDPEMRYLPDGRPVTTFSVASTRRWTGQDGQPHEETVWFRVSAFGKLAETCNQFLAKGRPVLIEGRLRPDDRGNPPHLGRAGRDGSCLLRGNRQYRPLPGPAGRSGRSGGGRNPGVRRANL